MGPEYIAIYRKGLNPDPVASGSLKHGSYPPEGIGCLVFEVSGSKV